MKVSVIIPVYNKGPFVREAVESILQGTLTDLEVVAVDDRSTDDSLAILRSIRDPRLRIIEREQNGGPAAAANTGLDACRGEYIARLDADDIALPERLAQQASFLDTHPEVGACGGQVQLFGAHDRSWSYALTPDACDAQQFFGVPISQGASMLRRSVVEEHRLRYDPAWPHVGEDRLFWLRVGRVTRFANLDSTVIRYRRGPQNISHGRDRAADMAYLQAEVFRWYGIPFTPEELELQLIGSQVFRKAPTAADVRALRAWYDRLLDGNARHGWFPKEAFATRVEQQWTTLFHPLVRYGASPALAHLRVSGTWPMERLAYLMKYRVNAHLGRVPNGLPA
ncbi:MAG TPA: glycosyltransferase family 2 protein [Flavobacteriales bacterium]|jgi:glycosyltransferase involved in cell wall biosynthesis|nr:glycosyltransferase family 2 protein [Flavobacteriales bacterium]